MEEEPDPGWTKPKQSFRLKKTIPRGRSVLGSSNANRTLPVLPSHQVKRKNQSEKDENESENASFISANAKRQRLGEIFSPSSMFLQNKSLPAALQRRVSESNQSTDSRGEIFSLLYLNYFNISKDSGVLSDFSCSSPDSDQSRLSQPPLDWSLKTRLRLVSASGLGWTQHLSTVEEASGVTGGVRCLSLASGDHCLDTSANAQFHSQCLYWQHPALPVPLYPRYTLSSYTRPPSTTSPALSLSPDMQRALHSDWMTSLQSVYQLVKARQCSYFYLLAPNFTVLFRAAGVSGAQQMTALISPTSTGVRAALKREEIEFSFPLFRSREAEDDEESQGPECDTTNEFLESLGIEADSLPGLSNHAPKNRLAAGAGSGQNIDGKPESLALVEGVECQSLLNYLLNAKLCVGKDQLPPTLLAPVAYHGASLRSLKVRVSQAGARASGRAQYSVDLTGPILPHTVQGLARLAAKLSPAFSVSAHTLEETVSFSMYQGEENTAAPSAFGTASLDDCGLDAEILKIFCARNGSGEQSDNVVRDLVFRDNGFIVNSQSQLGKK